MIQTSSLAHSIPIEATIQAIGMMLLVGVGIAFAIIKRIPHRDDALQTYIALAGASPHIVYLTDPSGSCIAVNQHWCEVTGQSYKSALGAGYREMIHRRDRDEEQRAWESACRAERIHEHQIRFHVADGSSRWHLLRSIPVRGRDGALIAWMATISNIDAPVRAADSMRFLADASAAIVTSLDVGDNLSTLTRVAAASFADFAFVWMRTHDDNFRLVSVAHANSETQTQLEREVRSRTGMQPCETVRRVLDGQGPCLASEVNLLESATRAYQVDIDATSVIIVPLDAGDQTLGALALSRSAQREAFDAQDVSIAMTLAKRAGAAVANARLFEASCALTKTLQSAFFPPFLPVMDGVSFEAVYRPAAHDAQVGGDWYDVFPLRDGRVALSIGDIMGHGVPAATAMVRMRETMRAAAASLDADPSAVLAFANRAMCSNEGNGLATAAFAVYDTRTNRLDYAVAGHPKPLLVRDNQCFELNKSSGMVLGIDPDARCTIGSVVLDVGDRIVLYTDGLIECRQNVVEGEQRLRQVMSAHESVNAAVDLLLCDGQSDDAALLLMSVTSVVVGEGGSSGWRFHSDDAASATSARASFASYLSRRGVEGRVIEVAELVFGELVSNVVRHAPGPIDISVRFESAMPVLTVGDRGRGLSYKPGRARLPDDVLSETGRGLFLIERLAATPHVQARRGGGCEITVPLRCVSAEYSLV